MPEETPFAKYIQQLEFTPGSPEWHSMTLAERVLASFADIMRDHVGDWLVNVVGSPPEALTLYCEALEAIGASSLATDIRALAVSDLDSDDSQIKLTKLNERVETKWDALWSAAEAYARQHGWMTSTTPKRIVILPQPEGDVVAHYPMGDLVGEFYQIPGGEIYLRYPGDSRHWYVNKSITAFREAAAVFNRCCELHADDEEEQDEVGAWHLRFRGGFEGGPLREIRVDLRPVFRDVPDLLQRFDELSASAERLLAALERSGLQKIPR